MEYSIFSKASILSFILVLASCTFDPDQGVQGQDLETSFTLAVAGDWDDYWGAPYSDNKRITTLNAVKEAGKTDLLVLLGDLSYGRDELPTPVEQAKRWCEIARTVSDQTPMIFVPGDHDSNRQDGDIATYSEYLTPPSGFIGQPEMAGYGEYPYLYYVDIERGNTRLRVVATSIAFQEEESEPERSQKYFQGYEKGERNYEWLKSVYSEARADNYWIIHINHLPCIDMGKNQSFAGCEDILNLNIEHGVNVMLTGSSHNIWRTHLLRYSENCAWVPTTSTAVGANPECAFSNDESRFVHGSGLVQAHAGAAGKLSASTQAVPCDPSKDGEAAHYLAEGSCGIDNVPGFVRLSVTENELVGEYVLTDTLELLEPYSFRFYR